MKIKYRRMNKEEKKECKQQYYSTEKGKEMNIRLTRLIFIGIIGILFSCFLIVNAYNTNSLDWTVWLSAVPLCIASIIFISASIYLRIKCLNNFAIKHMK